ncbi:MAG: hypothetical protein ABF484_06225, partial [Bifidobacterium sp.]|uniref:hypothetical protein n=1 Tax=Bifidobacterium sp. TaxID=41200 RepID=UPI0039EA9F60
LIIISFSSSLFTFMYSFDCLKRDFHGVSLAKRDFPLLGQLMRLHGAIKLSGDTVVKHCRETLL